MPKRVQRLLLDDEKTRPSLSVVSMVELGIKNGIGKLRMDLGEFHRATESLDLDVLPFTSTHARVFYDLPRHHKDPFDRMLIATAIAENIPLVGGDSQFAAYKREGLSVIWK